MLKIVKYHIGLLCLLFWASCDKDEARVVFEGGEAPKLTTSTDDANLSFDRADELAFTLAWTNPEYKFNTGVNSINVIYTLDIDVVGANFSGNKKHQIVFNGDLFTSFTVAQFNEILFNNMGLEIGVEHELELRVVASMGGKQTQLASNSVTVKGIPYAIPPKVPVPFTGELWMVGDATPNGWDNPLKPEYETIQKFSKVSETVYEITIDLPGGGGYKILQENGVWASQYHMVTGTWDNGTFELKDSDPQFPGPPSAGKYKITLDFQKGTYVAIRI